jgi:hypothetical protein
LFSDTSKKSCLIAAAHISTSLLQVDATKHAHLKQNLFQSLTHKDEHVRQAARQALEQVCTSETEWQNLIIAMINNPQFFFRNIIDLMKRKKQDQKWRPWEE